MFFSYLPGHPLSPWLISPLLVGVFYVGIPRFWFLYLFSFISTLTPFALLAIYMIMTYRIISQTINSSCNSKLLFKYLDNLLLVIKLT